MRTFAWLFVTLMLCGTALAAAPESSGSEVRTELDRLATALDEAVYRAHRLSAAHLLGVGGNCLSYRVDGVGAVFVMTPHVLPAQKPTVAPGETNTVPRAPARPRPRSLNRSPLARHLAPDEDLVMLEEQVMALQRASMLAHQEAERALNEMMRQAMTRSAPAGAATVAQVEPPDVEPPWLFWFANESHDDGRTAQQVIDDVRQAIFNVIEQKDARLVSLKADESLTIVIDFLPQGLHTPRPRPERTLIIRVQQRDLDQLRAGTLAREELRKRLEVQEY
ncbi:MAG: hypothetical protein MUF51_03060 [Vicinamibacteria bacterium]|jgi:hypothetical protein|nr:hypothetical protein [Vicinamibacteria bacterium]